MTYTTKTEVQKKSTESKYGKDGIEGREMGTEKCLVIGKKSTNSTRRHKNKSRHETKNTKNDIQ